MKRAIWLHVNGGIAWHDGWPSCLHQLHRDGVPSQVNQRLSHVSQQQVKNRATHDTRPCSMGGGELGFVFRRVPPRHVRAMLEFIDQGIRARLRSQSPPPPPRSTIAAVVLSGSCGQNLALDTTVERAVVVDPPLVKVSSYRQACGALSHPVRCGQYPLAILNGHWLDHFARCIFQLGFWGHGQQCGPNQPHHASLDDETRSPATR
jgi:hypothetical protein